MFVVHFPHKDKLSGSTPANNNKHSGITPFTSFKAFWELYISSNHVLISSGITPGDYKHSGSTPRESIYVLWE